MLVSLIKDEEIINFNLPNKIGGSYSIATITTDNNTSIDINIEGINNNWVFKGNDNSAIIYNNALYSSLILKENEFYHLKLTDEEKNIVMYCSNDFDLSFKKFFINNNCDLYIGKSNNNQIIYKNNWIEDNHCILQYRDGSWLLQKINNSVVYVNNKISDSTVLTQGDTIFIMGLKIIIVGNIIMFNNPKGLVSVNSINFSNFVLPEYNRKADYEKEMSTLLYEENDYFLRPPRFKTNSEKLIIKVDEPPKKEEEDDTPFYITMGPMMTMGMTSLVMGGLAVNNLITKKAEFTSVLPTLVMSGAMLCSMFLWPTLSRRYQKRKRIKKEKIRKEKYTKYIDEKRKEIADAVLLENQVLLSNHIPLEQCKNIIMSRNERLWERSIDDDDFLLLRVGNGDLEANIEIKAPEKHFTVEEDDIYDLVDNLVNESRVMHNVPICISLTKKNRCAIVGNEKYLYKFIENLILQMMTFHSYENLKIVCLTSEKNKDNWEFLKISPHLWSDDKSIRFFATNIDEMQQISNYLLSIFRNRKYDDSGSELRERNLDYKHFNSYYVIITDNLKQARNLKIIEEIMEQDLNIGFSVIIKNDLLTNLPDGCSTFINIGEKQSGMFENELVKEKQQIFTANFNDINIKECILKLANTPIELEIQKKGFPSVLGFLEMYGIGKIEQLNVLEKWKTNDPTISLQVPIGVDENGELFKLDLHEKFHGPHGLVAGMTGSGKSEFLITFILSLAVNFSPDEVSFIIIDYKGGGLAGAFENSEIGLKLPHLAGTITNLDKVEINRSLASIESELKRRQKMFNMAREELGESTIDIYKYQRLYREGKVKNPMPHLFIISDEFAELKSQQPEFMDQLISTARIGRSLGVHLILATQKPAGVVNDQIWSNSKFRVCLKVQEKADSMDMIKCPDAAALKETGRFYLQVGYNEFFALGQSAWCGKKYIESDKLIKKVDTSLNFVDNVGSIIKSADREVKIDLVDKGEELPNIVKYFTNIAEKENIKSNKLWLDKIPEIIYVDDLKEKYNYKKYPREINPVIGEYDDPSTQRQDLLTLPISKEGNAIIYGSVGSGKELLLNAIIYSSIVDYSVDDLNIYILDFGSESLKIYTQTPQVGDVLISSDNEKINNLYKMLRKEIDNRKQLFKDYNGDYNLYCEKTNNVIPQILIIINYYDAYQELYSEYEETLISLTREGTKYGIHFILTTTATNSIRYKLRQNFKQELALQMNDEMEYYSIFNGVRGIAPSKIKGRGLVKLDNIYEFQTAHIYKLNLISDYIHALNKKLKEIYSKKAINIPILPEKVTNKFLLPHLRGLNNVPIGINKNTLEIVPFDFKSKYISIISSQDIDYLPSFVEALINQFNNINDLTTIVLDPETIFNKLNLGNALYFSDGFDEVCKKLINVDEIKKNYVCIISNYTMLKEKLSIEVKKEFEKLLEKSNSKFNFVLVDVINKIKNYEYEPWFKNSVSTSYGIWIGEGISNQFTLKITKNTRELREEINNDFGFVINRGNPIFVKLLEYDDDTEILE